MKSQIQFFGVRRAKTRKEHICFGSMMTIPKGEYIESHTWKINGRMITKYYSRDCTYLLKTQACLRSNDLLPYNPIEGEFLWRFSQFFHHHFLDKYMAVTRSQILEDLGSVYKSRWKKFKYRLARLFLLDKKLYTFDRSDYKEFVKTYPHAVGLKGDVFGDHDQRISVLKQSNIRNHYPCYSFAPQIVSCMSTVEQARNNVLAFIKAFFSK